MSIHRPYKVELHNIRVWNALISMALDENRSPEGQIAQLVAESLVRAGYLTEEDRCLGLTHQQDGAETEAR